MWRRGEKREAEKEQRVGRKEGQAKTREHSRRKESTALCAAGSLGKMRKEKEALVRQHVGC